MRLFVAAELPVAVREGLASWARSAIGRGGQPRRLDAGALHLTLCFLGEQPESALPEIGAALAAVAELAAAVDELHLGAPVWLPPRHPRVLAVEVGDAAGTLRAVRDALVGELERCLDWDPGRERFRPHVTVARMRAGSERARELPPTPGLTFSPDAIALLRSDLDPAGATYTELASIPTA
jgi:2'-5' RNA ligase